jgi:hypothetical protein
LGQGREEAETVFTIFSVPKPFIGHTGIIQRNAIHSWSLLHPSCQVILCGDELGTREIATELKLKWIPDVVCNEYGTPLLNSVFSQAQAIADFRLMCYVNTDIILVNDFVEGIKRIHFREFVAVGQRWDVDLTGPWDFEQPDWQEQLDEYIVNHGVFHPPLGSDYFVFPRDSILAELPEFAVGRAGWDNWFIYRARRLGIPVVDVTRVVTVAHQNHDYGHVPESGGERTEGPEADWNIGLAGNGYYYLFSSLDATHVMTSRAVLPALGYRYLRRRLSTLRILVPDTTLFVRVISLVRNVIKHVRRANP